MGEDPRCFAGKVRSNEQVEGLVSYPHNYEEGKKYPLIVLIHGGAALG